jgi:hypothetical protein
VAFYVLFFITNSNSCDLKKIKHNGHKFKEKHGSYLDILVIFYPPKMCWKVSVTRETIQWHDGVKSMSLFFVLTCPIIMPVTLGFMYIE